MSALASTCPANTVANNVCCEILPIPILGSSQNYAYLIIDRDTNKAACVDPAEPDTILEAAKSRGLELSALLCTHKHWDHAGGNEAMAKAIPGLHLVGSATEDLTGLTHKLKDGETYILGSLTVTALLAPCHTRGHVLFLVTGEKGEAALFSGDTLFIGGCGRFFEGDAEDMHRALGPGGIVQRLPHSTRVYCGHEYTVSNLQFATSVEPDNSDVQNKLQWAKDTVEAGGYTIPSTIAEELTYNPFMRTDKASVASAAGGGDPVHVMGRLREMKNNYRPPSSGSARRMPPL